MPSVDRKKKQLRDLGINPDYKSVDFNRHGDVSMHSADPELAYLQEKLAKPMINGHMFKDKQHPENPDRSLLTDMEKLAERYHNSAPTLHGN